MKKLLIAAVGVGFLIPAIAFATPTSWDFASGVLQPLQNAWSAAIKGDHFVATSTLTASTFPYASTTALSVSGLTSGKCVQASTGGLLVSAADACGTGSGSGSVATSSQETSGRVPFWTSTNATPATLSGGSASLTWDNSNNILSSLHYLATGSSTLQAFTATLATTTAATTTNLFSTTASSTNLFTQNFNGAGLVTCNSTNALGWLGGTFSCVAIPQGTVTALSVASANGFAGSSGGGATPIITLTTTITSNVLKGTGTAITGAVNGTDYTLLSANTCGAGQFFNSATAAGVLGCATPSGGGSSFGNAFNFVAGTPNYLIGTTSPLGLIMTASTTIGGGTLTTGLTISGGATSTGNFLQIAGASTLASATTSTNLTSSVVVQGNYAYMAEGLGGLRIVDIRNPSLPTTVGTLATLDTVLSVAVAGKYAYVGDTTTGLNVVDVSNPKTPVIVGVYGFPGLSSAVSANSMVVSGRYVYMTDYNNSALRIVDVADPTKPFLRGSYIIAGGGGAPWGVAVQGKYAYIGDNGVGQIYIVDISNPTTPALVKAFTPTGLAGATPMQPYISGKYLYVADLVQGFYIVNVGDPKNPVLLTTTPFKPATSSFYSVTVAGTYAYLVDNGNHQISTVDISSTTNITLVSNYSTLTGPTDIRMNGRNLYVADGTGGLKILSVNGITAPAATIGALDVSQLQVDDDFNLGGNFWAGGSINAGLSGIFSRGPIASFIASTTQINPIAATFMGGSVGVGTTTTFAQFTIHATPATLNSNNRVFSIASSTATFATSTLFTVLNTGNTGVGTTTPWGLLSASSTSAFPTFVVEQKSTGPAAVLLGGNVGIGTTTPNATLTVKGTIASNDGVAPSAASGSTVSMFYDTGNTTGKIFSLNNGVAWKSLQVDGSPLVFNINSSGNVGVASTSPWRTFGVTGTVGFDGLTAASGVQSGDLCLSANKEVINDSVLCVASARRYKQDIKPLGDSLTELLKMQPVSFYYKPEYNGPLQSNPNYNTEQVGLIADDLQKIDPRLTIVTNEPTTFEGKTYPAGTVQGVNYLQLTAVIIKAVQELAVRQGAVAVRTAEENWQDALIALLLVGFAYQQWQIRKLKK